MKKLFFTVAILISCATYAQIGIGTATVDASAKLQVDATNKGFLQPRVALTSTTDTATIASPATGLMVFNTATAGTGVTAVTPGVYYHNESSWQRVTNQAELSAAIASPQTIVSGNLGFSSNGGVPYDSQAGSEAKSFGATITLPPGKWEVILNLTAFIHITTTEIGNITSYKEMSYWLQDNSTSSEFLNYQMPLNVTEITNDTYVPGGALFSCPILLGNGTGNYPFTALSVDNTKHNGSFFIDNQTSAPKTYYLFHHESFSNTTDIDGMILTYNALGSTSWKGNRFYAVKVN